MSDTSHLLCVTKEEGEFLFIYCDKYNVYALYKPKEDKLFLATMDKGLQIERAEVIELPDNFFNHQGVRFWKPLVDDKGIRFIGQVKIDGMFHRFTIAEEKGSLELDEQGYSESPQSGVNLLPVLDNFDIVHGIQRLGKFYFTGTERVDDEVHPVYGVVDMLTGKLETIYCLYSDLGEIVPTGLSLDQHETTVYVVGKIVEYDATNTHAVLTTPYIEKFFYRG